jgi:hypothetical protein
MSGCPDQTNGLDLCKLKGGGKDAIGATVISIEFRADNYAIYRSERGIYVHFSDDKNIRQSQVFEYTKLSKQLCELRYLTNQMRPNLLLRWLGFKRDLIYDHNMGQALMLLMETDAERRGQQEELAKETEKNATEIAQRALEMAIKRNTTDNTVRYVTACVMFGLAWLSAVWALINWVHLGDVTNFVIASGAGIVGAMFSVVVRAQTLDLKPCDDSHLNYMMSCVRVGMGGIAGPILLLLILTVAASAIPGAADALKAASTGSPSGASAAISATAMIQTVCVIGLLAGFAERMVPNLVQAAADRVETRAGTPGQATDPVKPQPIGKTDTAANKTPLKPDAQKTPETEKAHQEVAA